MKIEKRKVFFFKQKTAYEMLRSLVGSEMCIRDRKNPKVMFHVVGGSDDTIADTDSKNNKDKDIPRNEDGEEEVDIKPNNMRYAEELSSLIVTDVSGYVSIVRIDNLLAVLRGLRAGLEIATATNTTTTTSSSPKKKGHNTAASVVPTDQYNGCLLYTSDAADEEDSVDLGGRRIIKKKNKEIKKRDVIRIERT
eukprot:TRINITY_DN27222_c0_g1_i1.p1 TRINITY_DN27222_c0_g1~~TRINITY_DN27222_c0_g1_i1.p1  ORF type:complete len:194 (-),score=59.62 TRINITY_DN27222_c0_g1_i1:78-659(-)